MATVPAPLFISSRLMAALKIDDVGTLHLSAEGSDSEGRQQYRYVIEDSEGNELAEGNDLRSGCGDPVDYLDVMETLIGFLTACAESHPDGENADLFPEAVAIWADQHSDELAMAGYELSERDEGDYAT